MNKPLKKTILGLGLILAATITIVAIILFLPSVGLATPKITWTPNKISETVSPLESKSVVVSFTTSENINNVDVNVVPELQPYLQIQPSTFSSIKAGSTNNLTLTISASANSPLGTFDGTIQLKSTGKPAKTYAKPLPVTLSVGQKYVYENISFYYPTFGQSSRIEVEKKGEDTFIDVKILSSPYNDHISQFGFVFLKNRDLLSLTDWFKKNVDPTGILLSAGTFKLSQLTNGMAVLSYVAPVPPEYPEEYGSVSEFYSLSPDKSLVIILSRSQVNEFDIYGYNEKSIKELLTNILESMQF